MGARISKVYTRTGDDGSTARNAGERIAKDAPIIEAIGAIDELNCWIGLVRSHPLADELEDPLEEIQHKLFDLGGQLASPEHIAIREPDILFLEQSLDDMNRQLPTLKEFILPGGSEVVSAIHLARAVCRRAERRTFSAHKQEAIDSAALKYLNRLSDWLFVAARMQLLLDFDEEIYWRSHRLEEDQEV
jgi:cob(I)alamin adenosyltransferase